MSWMEGCCMSCELRRLTDPFPTPNLLSLSLAHSLTLPLSVPPPPPPHSFPLSLSLLSPRLLPYPRGQRLGRARRSAGGLPQRQRRQPGQEGVPTVAPSSTSDLIPVPHPPSFSLPAPITPYTLTTHTHNMITHENSHTLG